MSQELEVFKNSKPAQAFTGEPVESLSEGIGSSYGVISYKGKVWSLRYRGERYTFTRPDDGTPVGHIDVIILAKAPHKSKSYYEAYDVNNAEGGRPICASIDGMVPDEDVTKQQATACAICPRNVWKTNAEGRKSRECSDYMRLAVLLLPTQTKAATGNALMEPVFLRVPPASLNNLAVFGETMSGQGWPMYSFVTRIRFNPDVAHPEMVFSALQALTDAEGPVINPLRKDPLTLRITGGDQAPRQIAPAIAGPAPVQEHPHGATQPLAASGVVQQTTAAVQAAPVTATVIPPQPVDTGLTGKPPKDELIKIVEPPPPKVQVAGPILDLTPNPPATPAPQAAAQTVQDTGEPEVSDAALDARISDLLKI
jgi:hypothetical protein